MFDHHLSVVSTILKNGQRGRDTDRVWQPKDFARMEHPQPEKPKEKDPLAVIKRMDAYNMAYQAQFGRKVI